MDFYIVKHKLTSFVNDIGDINTNKARIFSDLSTASFVETILQDNITRLAFVDFIYHKINTKIQLNINKILIEKYGRPAMQNEIVQLVYKGGNIMNMYGQAFLKTLNNKIDPIVLKDLDKMLQVSDVDFSAHIYSPSYYKFYQMYSIVQLLINEELIYLCNFFENLLDNPKSYEKRDDLEFKEIFTDNLNYEVIRITLLINNYKKTGLIHKKDLESILLFLNNLENKCNLSYLIKVHQFISYYEFAKNKIIDKNNIEHIIKQILKQKKQTLINCDFYSQDNINNLRKVICDKIINSDNKKYYENITDSIIPVVNSVQKINNPDISNIYFTKREGSITKSTNNLSFFESIKLDKSSVHYITFNNVINVPLCSNFVTLNFDLMRIKFNIEIKNCLEKQNDIYGKNDKIESLVKIPSEFLDIAILIYGDYDYGHIKTFDSVIFNIDQTTIQLNAYNIKQICNDLSFVLFKTNYSPWLDPKYQKRIARLIYFYYMDNTPHFKFIINFIKKVYYCLINGENLKNILDPNIISYETLSHIIDNHLVTSHFLPLSVILTINSNYSIYNDLLCCILTFAYLHTLNTPVYFSFINNLREKYFYVPNTDISVVEDSKNKFIKFLETILYFGKPLSKELEGGRHKIVKHTMAEDTLNKMSKMIHTDNLENVYEKYITKKKINNVELIIIHVPN